MALARSRLHKVRENAFNSLSTRSFGVPRAVPRTPFAGAPIPIEKKDPPPQPPTARPASRPYPWRPPLAGQARLRRAAPPRRTWAGARPSRQPMQPTIQMRGEPPCPLRVWCGSCLAEAWRTSAW
eukprot:scaffold13706_cov121-Isochrysis_galbana.AAC.2